MGWYLKGYWQKEQNVLPQQACSLSSVRVMGVTKSGWCEPSAMLRSLKAGRVSDAGIGEAGSLCGIDIIPVGASTFQWPGCQ